jgi:acyl-CoA synthetase (AMP-forming)/AMP-acid ligase II
MTAPHATLVELLRARAAEQGDDVAFTFLTDGEHEGPRLTYAGLDAYARTIASALRDRGVGPGERALLLYPPGLDFIPAFFGCLYAGVIAVPAYPPQPSQASRTLPRLLSIVGDADVAIVLANTNVVDAATRMSADAPALAAIPWLATDALSVEPAADWHDAGVAADDLAFLQYTSGSTASPRGVMVTHANLLHNLAYASHAADRDRSTRSVSWLPVIHDMGLIEGVLGPIFGGYPAFLMAPASFLHRPIRWLRAITRYRASTSGGPNFAYDLCVRKITDAQREELDLSSWRTAYNGAEPIRAETLEAFHARFKDVGFRWRSFYPVYGLAESTLLVSTGGRDYEPVIHDVSSDGLARGQLKITRSSAATGTRPLVSSGPVSFGTEALIVDAATRRRCTDGRIGEIWVASPSVARGYWRRETETRETFRARLAGGEGGGPFLRTGDLGAIYDGELFVAGRLKDVLIVRGFKHYPQDIERTAEAQHAAIRAGCSAAFSIDSGDGETVGLALEVDRRHAPQIDDPAARDAFLSAIVDRVRAAIVDHHGIVLSAVSVLHHGAMPKTSSGKLRRRACREAFSNGSLDEIARWVADPELAGALLARRSPAGLEVYARHDVALGTGT